MSSLTTITIAVDAMGGDFGPSVTVPACVRALSFLSNVNFQLFGDKTLIEYHLMGLSDAHRKRVCVMPVSQVIEMDEPPAHGLRHKKDSSLFRAIESLSKGSAQACISAGNTGAMLAIGCHLVKTFAGIDRPAICTAVPTQKGRCFLLDIGANINVTAENLRQFAVMASVLASSVLAVEKPRVGLLNIGEEDIKGTQQVKLAASLFQADHLLNYVGFIEADQIFFDRADVVVCDGFAGNIALKAGEGVARFIAAKLKSIFGQSITSRFIAWLSRSYLLDLQQQIDPSNYNGASFLGLQSTLVKSHGNATVDAYLSAIKQAYVEACAGVPELIKARLQQAYIVTPEVE